jgi:hypothetical protein
VCESTYNLQHAVYIVHFQAVRGNVNELLNDALSHFRVWNLHDLSRDPIRYLKSQETKFRAAAKLRK